MKRIGVFVCHCGSNIAGTLDIDRIIETAKTIPGVVQAEEYKYLCSDPGQSMVQKMIEAHKLDAVVISACTPSLHEPTFRKAVEMVGMNPYQCEIANIREQCSWVHDDIATATDKAIKVISSVVEKVRLNESLEPITAPLTKKALVIGGGISGIQAALDIADSGYEVIVVEREPSIGGHMAQLSETFPTLDCSQCILTPKMVELNLHPNVTIHTYSEIVSLGGYVGNFKVGIRKKAKSVDHTRCTSCGLCYDKCPVKKPSEFERGLAMRKAIYVPFPQAIPNKPVIDRANCLKFTKDACGNCEKVCPTTAVDFTQQDEMIEEEVGAIVVASGYDLYPMSELREYGGGKIPDVVDGLQFERLLSASGPTQGEILRPSDGKVAKEVVFVQCAGSRDTERGKPYCSKICCMYTAKHAMLYKHKVHDGQAYIFYIDVRAGGKGYEEFYQRGVDEDGTVYLRGKVSRIFQDGDRVMVWGSDTLTGKKVEIAADMVVLAPATVPSVGTEELARELKIQVDINGFLSEVHPKLRPVESITTGFYVAGAGQAPKDIPEAVAQAGGAASKVVALFSGDLVHRDPMIVGVVEETCSGCGVCVGVCPYSARELDTERKKVKVIEVLCEGCGACGAACPTGSAQQRNLTDAQIISMVGASLGESSDSLDSK
ncbi:MAG: CoB--CoM heterodisulfide reductase iron-sulfur subunit A family protein [Candidatus Eisenbacteria bacterium]